MASGAIFTLLTNDGRQDRLLNATKLLNARLARITARRRADMEEDDTPTLVDIEKTHILFTNAHFKPFAAIGYEYNKVRASAGTPALDSDVQFSIPQFGDLFHDMVLHLVLKQPTLTATAAADEDKPLMRWCEYPGERVMKKTQFEVNGNPLDEYRREAYNFYREFSVGPHKKLAWARCMGQEVPEKGFVDQPNWVGNGVAPANVTQRVLSKVATGNQTPTGQKSQELGGELEMFIPLIFWCNLDPRLAVPSVAIPFGQRFINIQLAPQDELVGLVKRGSSTWAAPGGTLSTTNLVKTMELYINNIFVNPEVHDIFIKRIGFTLIRVHRQQNYNATSNTAEVLLQQMKWPIEYMSVGMKMKVYNSSDSTARRTHLNKWHKFSKLDEVTRSVAGWESLRSVPLTGTSIDVSVAGVVTITGGSAVTDGVTAGDVLVINGGRYSVFSVDGVDTLTLTLNGGAAMSQIVGATVFSLLRSMPQTSTFGVCTRTVDSITLTTHGVAIYNDFPAGFFNSYIPLHYGGVNLNAPEDCGAMFVPFCLYPGTYQPSGHINISRAREFYLKYTSSVVGTGGVEGDLVVVASAINFLLISDGSAVLRYTT
jgi:hypothetical protein